MDGRKPLGFKNGWAQWLFNLSRSITKSQKFRMIDCWIHFFLAPFDMTSLGYHYSTVSRKIRSFSGEKCAVLHHGCCGGASVIESRQPASCLLAVTSDHSVEVVKWRNPDVLRNPKLGNPQNNAIRSFPLKNIYLICFQLKIVKKDNSRARTSWNGRWSETLQDLMT